jgi:hypothetical protein
MFIQLFLESYKVIDISKTYSNMSDLVFYLLIIVFALGAIRLLAQQKFIELIPYAVCAGLAIFLISNPDKFMEIGKISFDVVIGLMKNIANFKENLPIDSGTNL